ncbi:juvenile hormone esterase-like isoform X1 [Diabrotica virgifera virgifera]|uniref:Carboxylic ester hydrolase n=1 Tax=Diabrotica virgifera virgifera TaxID=50390 RepID=A0ABM5JJB3_DIAVI|nr:juvenile hormone esterase-like isoform X1 [Diabrotica virgifera virgifera]
MIMTFIRTVIFVSCICGYLAFKLFSDTKNSNVLVETTKGWVLGKEEKTVNLGKTYVHFAGIPYAKPPVGDLRFAPPVPIDSWEGILDATKEGTVCVQFDVGNEDCLNLNIYVPQRSNSDTKPLSVIFYIHGGFFLFGNGGYVFQAPDYFIEEEIIFITCNYRLGILGFLSTEDDASYGNWGLKDQILALQWVKENIEFFGGDKNSITIMGQSAGSCSVNYLIQSPKAKDLFQKAIMHSGTSLTIWSFVAEPRKIAFMMGNLLGIDATDSKELVQRFREMDASSLSFMSTVINIVLEFIYDPKNGLMFAPTIEPYHEGAVLTERSYESLATGRFNKVPVLMGFVSQEGADIYQSFHKIRPYLFIYDLFQEKLLPNDLNIPESVKKTATDEVWAQLFNGSLGFSTTELRRFITEDQFVRPIVETARLMAQHIDVYFYRFSYLGESMEEDGPGIGNSHGYDLYYLFYYDYYTPNQKATDILTRRRMIRMWKNFATTSNPTLKDKYLNPDQTIWPVYKENGTYFNIGEKLTQRTNLSAYRIHWWNYIYKKYGTRPFSTY